MLHLEAVNLVEIYDLTTNDAIEIRKNLVADFQQHIEDSQEKEDELEPRDYDPEDDYWYHADTLPPTYEGWVPIQREVVDEEERELMIV